MPTNTYVALDKATVSSATATVNFTSIPQGYTDLVLVCNVISTTNAANYVYLQYNGDTATNYSTTILGGNGTSAVSARFTNRTNFNIDYYATPNTQVGNRIVNIQNYSNTTTFKTGLLRANRAGSGTDATVGLWRSTAAITSILITCDSDTFAAGSTFSLYGIAAAVVPTAKATGGTITYAADGYTYHTFLSSGTFTPTQSITCDYLVVAGGGGGGGNNGAGGGAGGLRSTVTATGGGGTVETALALTATGYTVTVGAGGAGNSNGNGTNGNNSVFGSITSTAGGGGGGLVSAGSNGGSGGGGCGIANAAGGTGTANQGFAGGAGTTNQNAGGGGGAGQIGEAAQGSGSNQGGKGGNGVQITAFANATNTGANTAYYAGGGGGGGGSPNPALRGTGGFGGGGQGSHTTGTTTGTANTGGGGGGSAGTGEAGGSGIVIVRYAS